MVRISGLSTRSRPLNLPRTHVHSVVGHVLTTLWCVYLPLTRCFPLLCTFRPKPCPSFSSLSREILQKHPNIVHSCNGFVRSVHSNRSRLHVWFLRDESPIYCTLQTCLGNLFLYFHWCGVLISLIDVEERRPTPTELRHVRRGTRLTIGSLIWISPLVQCPQVGDVSAEQEMVQRVTRNSERVKTASYKRENAEVIATPNFLEARRSSAAISTTLAPNTRVVCRMFTSSSWPDYSGCSD